MVDLECHPCGAREINEELEAALEQFRLIEMDLADTAVDGEQHEER